VPLVFAAIAPHGGLAVEEWCDPDDRDVARLTRRGFEELGRRFDAAAPEVTMVATPHHVHVEGALAVIVGAALSGTLDDAFSPVELTCPIDLPFAFDVLAALGESVPVVGVGFGSHDPEAASVPMDWGTLIPLWFLGGRADPPVPAVVVCPSRDLSLERHAEAGRALAAAAAVSERRIAFIASADHGHAHDPDGPYGFDPASAEFDAAIVDAVRGNRLERILDLESDFIERAKADSPWQLALLHGILGGETAGELLSYEAPTYFGMLCASYELAKR
jgi:aromatic ring-opening dioxygenase LigB subunit